MHKKRKLQNDVNVTPSVLLPLQKPSKTFKF